MIGSILAPILTGLVVSFGFTVLILVTLKSEREELSRLPRWMERRIGSKSILISKTSIIVVSVVWCSLLALALLLPWGDSEFDVIFLAASAVIGSFAGMFFWRVSKWAG